MKRRQPGDATSGGSDAVPEWVLQSKSLRPQPRNEWWKPWLPAGAELNADTYFKARRAHRAAAVRWCEERGYSYCRTVLGWRRSSSREIAAGCTAVPGGNG